jgi:ATP-dependent protease HslVU (ClpYQ) peptidase subunit
VKRENQLPTRRQLLDLRLEFQGLLVLQDGKVFRVSCREDPLAYGDEVGFTPVTKKFAACGSGNEIALGAMRHGATAREAVAYAAEFDINTRAPVHVVRLKPGV